MGVQQGLQPCDAIVGIVEVVGLVPVLQATTTTCKSNCAWWCTTSTARVYDQGRWPGSTPLQLAYLRACLAQWESEGQGLQVVASSVTHAAVPVAIILVVCIVPVIPETTATCKRGVTDPPATDLKGCANNNLQTWILIVGVPQSCFTEFWVYRYAE